MQQVVRHFTTAALAVAVVLFAAPSSAQSRLSLSERLTRLEQQALNDDTDRNVEMLNRLNQLQTELQTLRDMVERQRNELEALQKRSRDQYLDIDSRLRGTQSGGSDDGGFGQSMPTPVNPVASSSGEDDSSFGDTQSDVGFSNVPSAPAIDVQAERAAYDEAFSALKQGNYQDSGRLFAAYLDQFPQGDNAPNAMYWLGESHYVNQRYQDALKAFQQLLAQYPRSGKAPDSLLKVGYCYYQIGDTQRATQTLNSVIQNYPDSAVAKLAQSRLRTIQANGR